MNMNKLFLNQFLTVITQKCRFSIRESHITLSDLSKNLGYAHKSYVLNALKSSRFGLFDLVRITYYLGNKEFVASNKEAKFKITLSDNTDPKAISEYEIALKNYDVFEGNDITWQELGEKYGFASPRTQAFQNWKMYDTPVMLVILAAYLCGKSQITLKSEDGKKFCRLDFSF